MESHLKEELIRLFSNNELWLVKRIIYYVNRFNYSKYTSGLKDAWQLSISGLSSALITCLREDRCNFDIKCEEDLTSDPIADFGILEARRHLKRGVDLGIFLGLFKYYHDSYVDLILLQNFEYPKERAFQKVIDRLFDRIEIAFLMEWTVSSDSNKISSLHRVNQEMTHEKDKFTAIFESYPQPVFVFDENSHLIHFNYSAVTFYKDHFVSGVHFNSTSSFHEINAGDERNPENQGSLLISSSDLFGLFPYLNHALSVFIKKDLSHVTRVTTLKVNKDLFYFKLRFSKLLDVSTKLKGVVLVFEDITEQKRAVMEIEQAKKAADEANHAKGLFLAKMSHELRTPLNAILGYAQILENEKIHLTSGEKGLGIIKKSGEYLLALINDVLDISKMEHQGILLHPLPVHLKSFLDGIVGILKSWADSKGLSFVLNTKNNIPEEVLVDETRLKQVLLNLLGNAVKFTDKGFVKLNVFSLGVKKDKGHLLRFEVADSGCGIDPKEWGIIFKPFEQSKEGLTQNDGAGLGLAISQQLVKLMKSCIYVKSQKGKGSVFFFDVALKEHTISKKKRFSSSHETLPPGIKGLEPSVLPPLPLRFELLDLAKMGCMRDIELWARNLMEKEDRYAPFAKRIVSMAKEYKEKDIMSCAEMLMRSKSSQT